MLASTPLGQIALPEFALLQLTLEQAAALARVFEGTVRGLEGELLLLEAVLYDRQLSVEFLKARLGFGALGRRLVALGIEFGQLAFDLVGACQHLRAVLLKALQFELLLVQGLGQGGGARACALQALGESAECRLSLHRACLGLVMEERLALLLLAQCIDLLLACEHPGLL